MEEEKNMNEMRKKLNMGASVVVVALMLTMLFLPLTSAVPIQPFERSGTTTANATVTAWIDGVKYGTNTSDASGNFVIDVNGDDVDTTDVKEGGINDDIISYMIDDQFAAETDVYTAGSVVTGDLSVAGTQPAMLKISKIITQPNDGNTNQYLYIYNPSASAVDLSAYQLEKNDGSRVSSVFPLSGTVAAGDFFYVDLGSSSYFNTAGDEVKLNFTTTGVIVDRVEFGTQSAVPDNTIMGDAPAPGLGEEIYRTPNPDTDTDDCSVDFTTGSATDRIAPSSSADALPTYETSTTFAVTATASDDNTSGNASGVASVMLYWDTVDSIPYGNSVAMTYVTGDNVTGSSWTYDFTGTDGTTYYFYTVATDVDGNVEADPAAYDATTTIDATAPSVSITDPADGAILNTADVTVTWTGSDATSGIDYYTSSIDGGAAVNEGTGTSHAYTGLSEGSHTVTITAYDVAGNSNTATVTFTVDTTAPSVSITSPSDGALLNTADVTVDWTGSDATSGIDHYTISIDGGAATDVGTSTTYTYTGLSDGSHTVTVTAYDGAGNTNTDSVTFTVDTTAPTVISTTPADGAVDVSTAAGTYSIQFSEAMDTTVAVTVTTDLPGASWSWSADGLWYNATYTALTSNTVYNVDLTGGGFVDLAGNALTGDITFTFTTVAYTATATGPTGSGGLDVTITYTYTGTPAAVTIWYSDDGNTTWTQAGVDTTVDGSFAFTVPAAGTYYWFANATDDAAPASGDAAEAGSYDASSGAGTATVATGLWVEKDSANNNIILHWTDTGSTEWHIYGSQNRFNVTDSANLIATVTGPASSWTHAGAYGDGLNWFYIVRGYDGVSVESTNSTMGYKIIKTLGYNDPSSATNGYWVSIPYNTSYYKDLDSIIIDIEGGLTGSDDTYINAVYAWDGANQKRVGKTVGGFGWSGTNVALNPGDAVYIARSDNTPAPYDWSVEIVTPAAP